MNKEELYKKLCDIHLLYSMPYKAENMRPEHYAIKGYEKLAYEQCAEIERLNNIINELEKYLEEFDFTAFICGNRKASKSIELGARLNNDFILDKLKELKEGR